MNSPQLARFIRTIESPTISCPVCAQQRRHRSFCEIRHLRKITRGLIPSNPHFRISKLSDGLQQHLLDGACNALLSRGVYDVLGIDETLLQQLLLSTRSVAGFWAHTQSMALSVSFFSHIDRSTARKLETARHALGLYAQVNRLGGIDYQMLHPETLAFVGVFRYFIKCWATKNRRSIKSFTHRRPPPSAKNTLLPQCPGAATSSGSIKSTAHRLALLDQA